MGRSTNKAGVFLFSILVIFTALSCNTVSNKKKAVEEATDASPLNVLSAVIDSVHSEIKDGSYGLIDRFMVIHNGEELANFKYVQDYESIARNYDTADHQYNYNHPNWHPYYQQTDLHTMQSVTKSVTSILLGIAFDQHPEYNVNTKVIPMFTEYVKDTRDQRKNEMTIEDLLTMRSGLQWDEGNYLDPADDCIMMEASNDWIQYVLDKPSDTLPGTYFEYNSGVSVLLGKIVSMITGKRIDEFAEERLFRPLGITDYYWKKTPKEEIDTEGGLYLKTEDLAKIGKVYLQNGKWENEQIVSESWVKASISPIVTEVNPERNTGIGYGYQWWVPEHANGKPIIFAGNGFGGQYLMVAPEYDLIVVFDGWNINEQAEKSTWDVLQERMLPMLNGNR